MITASILKDKSYDFLRTNPHLGRHLLLIGLAGSHAYGTDTPDSDMDLRGIAADSRRDLLGLRQQNDLYLHPLGQELLNHRRLFLSKRAVQSFGGYAGAQLRRLQNALARDSYPQAERATENLGKYGRMRKRYLQAHRPGLYNHPLLSGAPHTHLLEIDQTDRECLELIMPEMAKAAGATKKLKAHAPLRWVGLINTCKAQAKEHFQSLGYCHIQRPTSKFRISLEKRRYLCIMEKCR